MTTPTVPVTVTLASQDGSPLVGVTVWARLDVNEIYFGQVISQRTQGVTNAQGVAVLNCFPNAPAPTGLGTQGSVYQFLAKAPSGLTLDVQARVPNVPCRLENILVNDTVVSYDAAQLAVFQAQQAITIAAGSAIDAENSAIAAAASEVSAAGSASAAASSATAAATSAAAAALSEDNARSSAERLDEYLGGVLTGITFPLDLGLISDPVIYNHFDLGSI